MTGRVGLFALPLPPIPTPLALDSIVLLANARRILSS